MSVASEISRLQTDSAAIASAIAAKGITVPSGSGYDDYATLIAQIGGTFPFKLLTYIQTDGTAYINTGIKANVPLSVELRCTLVKASSGNTYFMGARSSSTSIRIVPLVVNSGKTSGYYYADSLTTVKSVATSLSNYTPIEVNFSAKAGAQSFSIKEVGDESFTTNSSSLSSGIITGMDLPIFAFNSNGTISNRRNGERLYYCRIYGDETYQTPVFLGYPCYYNGTYGLWDFVSNSFFGNAADSGSFTGA